MIKNIKINNVIGVDLADIDVGETITLICGGNATGKSSALDAIAYAITGVKHRNLEPIAQNSVLAGEILSESSVSITDPLGDLLYGALDGKVISREKEDEVGVVPGAYLRLPPKDRVRLLLSACKVRVDPREIVAKFEGIADEDREIILNRAAIDWDTAEAWCREQARKLKSRWQAITGEEWGAKKAGKWSATIPEGCADTLESQVAAALAEEEQLRALWQKLSEELGAANAAANAIKRPISDIDADISAAQAELDRLAPAVGMQGTIEPCPHCGKHVVRPAIGGPLQKAAEDPAPSVVEASAERDALRTRLSALGRERGSAQAALDLSVDHRPVEVITAERKAAGEKGAAIKAERAERERRASAIREAKEATAKARAINKSIEALLAAAIELSPEGARARAMESAIAKVNAVMSDISSVRLNPKAEPSDTKLLLDVAWLSESEQWRANASIAMALAQISGSKVVLIDRFDCVEPEKRMPALSLINSWSAATGIQVIMAATLKGKPEIPGVAVHWMGG
jgi:DNA repair exonuclease SbcCD ATPase subunit